MTITLDRKLIGKILDDQQAIAVATSSMDDLSQKEFELLQGYIWDLIELKEKLMDLKPRMTTYQWELLYTATTDTLFNCYDSGVIVVVLDLDKPYYLDLVVLQHDLRVYIDKRHYIESLSVVVA
jgi:hypothetical protein